MKTIKYLVVVISLLIPVISFASIDTNLRYGSKGQEVQELQEFLTDKGFYSNQISGNFFTLTRKSVMSYQSSVGLPVTGFVGPMTREKINAELIFDTSKEETEDIVQLLSVIPTSLPVQIQPLTISTPEPTVVTPISIIINGVEATSTNYTISTSICDTFSGDVYTKYSDGTTKQDKYKLLYEDGADRGFNIGKFSYRPFLKQTGLDTVKVQSDGLETILNFTVIPETASTSCK
jgi:peptidoglycan hydrolase-like protein with peptidoglycan-binding domain